MTRSSPAPSRAIKAAGVLGNVVALGRGAACCAATLCLPFSKYFTPRKSPDPSSPTVAANRMGRATGTRAAAALRTGRRGNGRERRLAGERHLIGALDVMARRANALVREQARDGVFHGPTH